MTAPASIQLSPGAPRPSSREAAPAAANGSAAQEKTAGFAAHLAEETDEPQRAVKPAPILLAAEQGDAAIAPAPAEEPGKTLPPTRQTAAALLAATGLLLAAKREPAAATETDGEPATPADLPEAETPGTPTPPLTMPALALPVPAPVPAPLAAPVLQASAAAAQPAPKGTASAAPSPSSATARPALPGTSDPAPAQSAPAITHPAAFAVANLVLERETAVPALEAAPPAADTPPTATQIAARAQPTLAPSLVAALTATPDRPGPRKPRGEAENALAGAKSAASLPDTAGALALSQAAPAPAGTAPAATGPAAPTAAGPQPISFDQLVDSIARARDGADQGSPVAVALRHGEFGRVSLRIESDATGLSVAMASPDPAFAPAVAAAHAAAAIPEPLRPVASASRTDASGQGLAQGQSHAGSGQQQHSGGAQRPAANPARAAAAVAERRSGIFA